MARTTQLELDHILAVLNRKLGTNYIYSKAYGKRRLCSADQSTELSPPLSAGELYRWMEAANVGIDLTNAKIKREAAEQTERKRAQAMCNGYTNWETWHVQLVVDNDEGLFDERDLWLEPLLLESNVSAEDLAELMPDTAFYLEAIDATVSADEDSTEIHIRQQVNWLELAQENISDLRERRAHEEKYS